MTRRGSGPLIDVRTFHAQESLRLQGIPTARERQLAQERSRRADPLPEKPRDVTGNIDDGTLLEDLMHTLEAQGRVRNKSERGGQHGLTYHHPILVAPNIPPNKPLTQASADTTSTTNTGSTVAAMSIDIALDIGKWTVWAIGGVSLTHSSGGSSAVTVQIDGVEGDANVVNGVPSSGGKYLWADHTEVDVEGEQTITVRVRYRSNSSGTTAAQNPAILVGAWRSE